jgi:hypothetical protein
VLLRRADYAVSAIVRKMVVVHFGLIARYLRHLILFVRYKLVTGLGQVLLSFEHKFVVLAVIQLGLLNSVFAASASLRHGFVRRRL